MHAMACAGPLRSARRKVLAQPCCPCAGRRAASGVPKPVEKLAKSLEASQILRRGRGRPVLGSKAPTALDNKRVNIVSESLCDDILKYIGPSLERHRGCDLIDLNPGVGLWSRKVHELLQPRKHIMMDLDAEVYRPWAGELMDKDNVEVIQRSGIVWKHLLEMLKTKLPEQRPLARGETPERNDTLLVIANLASWPRASYNGFSSVGTMVQYQLMTSIANSALFQRYGLVRMLLWTNDDEKRKMLPRCTQRRKRAAFEVDLSCEWLHEVAGVDVEVEDRLSLRDEWLNLESAYGTLERMQKSGTAMPEHRMTAGHAKALENPELMGQMLAGKRLPQLARPYVQEVKSLEARVDDDDDEPEKGSEAADDKKRKEVLQRLHKVYTSHNEAYLDLLNDYDRLMALSRQVRAGSEGAAAKFRALELEYNAKQAPFRKNQRNEYNLIRDNYHAFRHHAADTGPGLMWDRRAYEPLAVKETDFYPASAAALLDIQPKAMKPLFRERGAGTSRAGDLSDVLLRGWFNSTLAPMPQAMDSLWPGFGVMYERCPAMRDPTKGGLPPATEGALAAGEEGYGELLVRSTTEDMWAEVVRAWVDWPFRPPYVQMLGDMVDDDEPGAADEDTKKKPVSFLP